MAFLSLELHPAAGKNTGASLWLRHQWRRGEPLRKGRRASGSSLVTSGGGLRFVWASVEAIFFAVPEGQGRACLWSLEGKV